MSVNGTILSIKLRGSTMENSKTGSDKFDRKQFADLEKYASEKGFAKSAVVILALEEFLKGQEK